MAGKPEQRTFVEFDRSVAARSGFVPFALQGDLHVNSGFGLPTAIVASEARLVQFKPK